MITRLPPRSLTNCHLVGGNSVRVAAASSIVYHQVYIISIYDYICLDWTASGMSDAETNRQQGLSERSGV
jgi:hypothetical protein